MKIVFLDRHAPYLPETLGRIPVGGIATVTVHLAEALAARGHEVTVAGPADRAVTEAGVRWVPWADAPTTADLAVANSDARLLGKIAAGRRAVWLHNVTFVEKLARQGRLWPILRLRPEAVLLSRWHAGTLSPLLPFRRRHVLPHGVGAPFLEAPPATAPPPPRALFLASAYRGLEGAIRLWRTAIRPRVPGAELHALCLDPPDAGGHAVLGPVPAYLSDPTALARDGVIVRPRLPKAELAAEYARARLLLYPGYPETFCLLAAEAIAMGVPVVTHGTGALAERVEDGVTGFVAPDEEALVERTVRVLTDDALWRRLQAGGLATRAEVGWDRRAALWEAAFAPG